MKRLILLITLVYINSCEFKKEEYISTITPTIAIVSADSIYLDTIIHGYLKYNIIDSLSPIIFRNFHGIISDRKGKKHNITINNTIYDTSYNYTLKKLNHFFLVHYGMNITGQFIIHGIIYYKLERKQGLEPFNPMIKYNFKSIQRGIFTVLENDEIVFLDCDSTYLQQNNLHFSHIKKTSEMIRRFLANAFVFQKDSNDATFGMGM